MRLTRSRLLAGLVAVVLAAPGIVAVDALDGSGFDDGEFRQKCGACHPRGGADEPPLEDWWGLEPDVPANLSREPGSVQVGLVIRNGFEQRIEQIDAALNLSGILGAAEFVVNGSSFMRTVEKAGTGPGDRRIRAPSPVTGFNLTFEAEEPGAHWNASVRRGGETVASCRTGPETPPDGGRSCRVSWQRSGPLPSGAKRWRLDVRLVPASPSSAPAGGWTVSGEISHHSAKGVRHKTPRNANLTALEPGESQRVEWTVEVRDPGGVPDNVSVPFRVGAQFAYDHDEDGTCEGYPDCASASTTVEGQPGEEPRRVSSPAEATPSVGLAGVAAAVVVAAVAVWAGRGDGDGDGDGDG